MRSSSPRSRAWTRSRRRSTWPARRSSWSASSPASSGSSGRSSRVREGRVRLHLPGLPALAGPAHDQRPHGRRGADRPDPVRVLRAGGPRAALAERQPGPAEHQPGAPSHRHRDDDVRPPDQALRAGRGGGPAVLRRPRVRRHHPADGAAVRGARVRQSRSRSTTQVQRRASPTGTLPARSPSDPRRIRRCPRTTICRRSSVPNLADAVPRRRGFGQRTKQKRRRSSRTRPSASRPKTISEGPATEVAAPVAPAPEPAARLRSSRLCSSRSPAPDRRLPLRSSRRGRRRSPTVRTPPPASSGGRR